MDFTETKTNLVLPPPPVPQQPVMAALTVWFFTVAPRNIVEIWGNYLAGTLHYFSIPLLLRTLVSHWRKDEEGYGRGFDFGRYLRVFLMNMISRVIGAIVRLVVIAFGLTLEFIILVGGIAFLIFWLAIPLLIPLGIIVGLAKM